MKHVLIHLSQFKQNTSKVYRPRMIRGNEINSALAIKELAFEKKKKKKKKRTRRKKKKKKLMHNSVQIYNEAKAVIYKQNGATIYIVAFLPLP
jgi:hypothetical protein